MRSRNKVFADRIIARPIAFLLNCVVFPLGKILHIDHDDDPEKVKTIAIAKLLGMGSILRATPMVRALKQKYPNAKYIIVTTLRNKDLVERIPLFDKYLYMRDSSFLEIFFDSIFLLFKLWRARIDLYFDLEVYSAFSTILATLSLARNRYGLYRESTRFRMGLNTYLTWFNDQQHISKIYLQLIRDCDIKSTDYRIEALRIRDGDKREIEKWALSNKVSLDEPYIIINPNASDLLFERRWPTDYFVSLLNALAINWHHPIFLIGSPEEFSYVDSLWNSLSDKAKQITFNLAGKVSLGAVIVLISKTKLMVSNDSGLYHLASSFDVSTVSLWGPGDPAHYADGKSEKNFIFRCQNIYCSPCIHKPAFPPCKGNNICMKSIDPVDVYKKICEILHIAPKADLSTMKDEYKRLYSPDSNIVIGLPIKKKDRKRWRFS